MGVFLAASSVDARGIRTDQTAWGWGNNDIGQLGNNTKDITSSPVSVAGARLFTDIAVGERFTLGLQTDGSAWGWGVNWYGELGTNNFVSTSSPVAVVGNHSFVQLVATLSSSFGLKSDGSVWSWGMNSFGNLGLNTKTISSSSPSSVTSVASPMPVVGGHVFSDITGNLSAYGHTIAMKQDGSAWAWGYNSYGQLGTNTQISTSSPVSVLGGHSFIKIVSGKMFTLGLKADGSVWSWGRNVSGELGHNNKVDISSPVSVVGAHSFVQIAAGYYHSMARKADGSVWTWGQNLVYGALGDNTQTRRSSPVSVVGGHVFIDITGGSDMSLALDSNRHLWAWGKNSSGQLGLNDKVHYSSPMSVVGGHLFGSPVTGWAGKVMGITNPGKVLGIEVANIAQVNKVS